MFNPRDIIRREDQLYVVEQVVEDKRGVQLLVKDMDSDSRWIFGAHTCELAARRSTNRG